jgi:hypothetical protein
MKTMIKTKIMMLAAILMMIVVARTAQATLVLGPTTVDISGTDGAASLSVDYYVCLSGTTYTYYFVLTPPAGSGASSFTVDISDPAVLSDITSTSSAYVPPPIIDSGESVTWEFSDLTGVATNSFQSQYSPTVLGMSSATSVNGTWVDPPNPTAVPEASTIIAGMLMILPLSVGIFRALRKARDISDLRTASESGFMLPGWANVPNASKDVPPRNRRKSFLVV